MSMFDEYDELKAFALNRYATEEAYCANGAQASDGDIHADDSVYDDYYDINELYEGYDW